MEVTGSSLADAAPEARTVREAAAYDDGRVVERHGRWVALVPHVMAGPNSVAGDRRFLELLGERAAGARALDVGCGMGDLSAQLHAMGARTVYGFDVSQRRVEEARVKYGDLEGVAFHVHSDTAPIAGQFDLIAGQAILHHLDFRVTLTRLFTENLRPGGRMVFIEPMSHPLTLAFHGLVRSAHTPDEWPLTPADVAWLRRRLAARVVPINLLSFPAGVVSSLVWPSADNGLMRVADRVDRALERRRRLLARGRQGIVVIDRPHG